jgi:hypothetical protein
MKTLGRLLVAAWLVVLCAGAALAAIVYGAGASPAEGGGWTDGGTTVRLTTVSDKVGIGTASPTADSKVEIDTIGDFAVGLRVTSGTITCPGSGSNTERFGAGSSTGSAANAVVMGRNAVNSSATSNEFVLIGAGATITAGSGRAVIIGYNATTSSQDAVAVGPAAVGGNGTVSVGRFASATGFQATAIGYGTTSSTSYTIALGTGATASTSNGNMAAGHNSTASGADAIAIGDASSATHADTITLGFGATSTTTGQFVVGSDTAPTTAVYIGRGVTSTTPSLVTITATGGSGAVTGATLGLSGGAAGSTGNGGEVSVSGGLPTDGDGGSIAVAGRGGVGTNRSGGRLQLRGGSKTGTGVAGDIMQQASTINRVVMVGEPKTLVDATATSLFEVALPTLTMAGGKIEVTVNVTDGTDMQSFSQTILWSAVNKAGVYTTDIDVVPTDLVTGLGAKSLSAGTLTTTWTVLTGTNKVTIQVASDTSLTATSHTATYILTQNSPQQTTVIP